MLGEVVCGEMMIESGGKFIGESREMTDGGLIVSFPESEKTRLAQVQSQQSTIEIEKTVEHNETELKPK